MNIAKLSQVPDPAGWVWALFPAFLSQPTGKVLPSFAECWPLAEFKLAYNKGQNWCWQQMLGEPSKKKISQIVEKVHNFLDPPPLG